MSEGVCILAPLRDPSAAVAVSARIRALDAPFAALEATHFGRIAVVDGLEPPWRRPERPVAYVLLSAEADGDPRTYVLRVAEQPWAQAVWGDCLGFPGAGDAQRVARWLWSRRVRSGFAVRPYPRATVLEVRGALAFHARMRAFAVATQDLEPAALQAAWREEFGAP